MEANEIFAAVQDRLLRAHRVNGAPRYSSPTTRNAEVGVAEWAVESMKIDGAVLSIPNDVWGEFSPKAAQRTALEGAARHQNYILTGYAGTGKTTVAKAILAMYRANGLVVEGVAPTGAAAVRLTESTGIQCLTIHSWAAGGRDGEDRSTPDVVMVDETSMCDGATLLMLLEKLPVRTRILVIGDPGQLASVGPGQVLADFIQAVDNGLLRGWGHGNLVEICRNAKESAIPYLAEDVRKGRIIESIARPDVGLTLFPPRTDPETIHTMTVQVADLAHRQIGFARDDIMVLAAQYQENAPGGIIALNNALQNLWNGSAIGDAVPIGRNYEGRRGDRVVFTKNDVRRSGIANGTIGVVVGTSKRGGAQAPDGAPLAPYLGTKNASLVVRVRQGDKTVFVGVGGAQVRHVELAYAMSIHKAQGCQWACVILSASARQQRSWTARLAYTAITRAAKRLLVVADQQTFCHAGLRTTDSVRETLLVREIEVRVAKFRAEQRALVEAQEAADAANVAPVDPDCDPEFDGRLAADAS
jgi:exodeoxyribonuclease V alpha subunit